MTIPRLTIIPAGAGSGKTYRIQTQLADWVVKGLVAPDRILAVTFTKAAASELKNRIRFELIRRGRIEDALKLEASYLSTIHGFGMRLLSEFAFEGGISPSPRLLNEDEQGFLIRRTLQKTDKADAVATNLRKYGYRYDPATKTGPEEVFLASLLSLIDRLRSLGGKGEDPSLVDGAVAALRRLYGPTESGDALNRALHGAVARLLKRFPGNLSPGFEGNEAAAKQFRDNFRSLRRADDPDEVASDWSLWVSLKELRIKAKGGTIPAGYEGLAREVMTAAAKLHRHPGPLADAERHAGALLCAGQDCLAIYGQEKRKASLVDYPDMLAGTHEILSNRPDVLEILKKRVDCLVIDEFQDTNPLQFSLLWKIHQAGVPALIVGDVKQSIMGFQNADPRLFGQLERQYPKACDPLTANWRSSAPLMEWVNAVGDGLFGKGYTRLAPKAEFKSAMVPLEVVDAPKFIRSNRARASWTAVRLKALLEDKKCKVWDKLVKASRRIRGGDIAVLCPTHDLVAAYADTFRSLGVRTRVKQDRWHESPVVRILCHALAYIADIDDRHAALYLAVTELGSNSFEAALSTLRAGERLKDPVLERLEPLRSGASEKTIDALVGDVIEAVDLYGRIAQWPDSAQARANALRFQAEAGEFREANRQVLLAGGYYGNGVKTFLAWLSARVEEKNAQPEPRVVDEDAVTVTTWHGAKGLEWPVVAVCGMNREIKPRLPAVSVTYDDFADLSTILRKARVEIVPVFAAEETNAKFQARLQPDLEEEARRLLYVALTRAREKVILEWPSHLAGKDKSYYWSLLTEAAGMTLEKGTMRVRGKTFTCIVNPAGTGVAPSVEASAGEPVTPLSVFGRRALEYRSLPADLTPETVIPSALQGDEAAGASPLLIEETYGPLLETVLPMEGAERGRLLHKWFEVLGGRAGREDFLERATGVALEKDVAEVLCGAVAAFDRWVEGRFHPLRVRREIPILGLDARGSVVSGVLDLLVETVEGYWILDHKSDIAADRPARFEFHLPQLRCYADIIGKALPGKRVLGTGIHWITYGTVILLPEGEGIRRKNST
jgi:ATP-dependent exoDNAse (exonuclease V) beta subunit